MKTIADINLKDLLPQGVGADANVQAAAQSLDPHLQAIGKTSDAVTIYANVGALTHQMLDALAVQFDATNWKDSWSRELKVSVLKTVIANKRKVGTLKAVREAVQSLGNHVEIIEWFNETPRGEPHTFRVNMLFGGTDADVTDDVIRAINLAKPARSRFKIVAKEETKSGIISGGAMTAISYIRAVADVNL